MRNYEGMNENGVVMNGFDSVQAAISELLAVPLLLATTGEHDGVADRKVGSLRPIHAKGRGRIEWDFLAIFGE